MASVYFTVLHSVPNFIITYHAKSHLMWTNKNECSLSIKPSDMSCFLFAFPAPDPIDRTDRHPLSPAARGKSSLFNLHNLHVVLIACTVYCGN